ncbi:hypothetical protein M184_gp59 [Mycobacterium phage WIVsmall]|uniref:hypothetical protein n=1 Tax=Mycobacterium phage WIVsmall TaxID=1327036 RepID=UPI00032B8613|nr:hypothetical protein M184_gp59 [Mycobacterium phage WIVsmall]AGK88195.1 hypothetical protein WIVsmall_59 [Mycobacterium phage WIVsmall]
MAELVAEPRRSFLASAPTRVLVVMAKFQARTASQPGQLPTTASPIRAATAAPAMVVRVLLLAAVARVATAGSSPVRQAARALWDAPGSVPISKTEDEVNLLVPCPKCWVDIEIELVQDDAGRGLRAPDLIDAVNEHVISEHGIAVSGK